MNLLAQLARRQAKCTLERPDEASLRSETGIQRHLNDGPAPVCRRWRTAFDKDNAGRRSQSSRQPARSSASGLLYDFEVMKMLDLPDTPKQLRKAQGKFQQTFKTPLKRLEPFVAAILLAGAPETASITLDQVVFEPKQWLNLLARYSLPSRYEKGVSVTAAGLDEIQELLSAAFADWVDFFFIPNPKPFLIYADHDEYATFYANTRSNLNCIVQALLSQGFQAVTGYTRRR